MTARKPGLSRRQHVELGEKLQATRDEVLRAVTLLSNVYPVASRQVRAAETTLRKFDELRSALDDVSARELPGDLWSPTIYYGANREQRAAWLAANPLDDEPGGA
ncbi:hypothetical protein ACFFX1_55335 [Dactylosporangium sucinum]|uniref:Uncharacterized protein n=1 Tax=Dactylosporangium sucinum TaxID=1424081 RepID=A0A917X1M7_9ACTN|nr:hypothetical protein [Dactylosporangium sucinum]GGM52820.1 hypothetical protein GCM10007977_062970 [Dactylosporangium sucinum]